MKKGFIIISCLAVFLLSGCGCTSNNKESIMKDYGNDYYKKFMKDYAEGNDAVEITIEMLEEANKRGNTSYDLSKLKGCTSSSKVIFTLKKNSTDIQKTEYKLNCK